MTKKKEPAKVWVEDNLIKIKPFKTEKTFILDYSEYTFKKVYGKRWTCWNKPYPMAWVDGKNILLHHIILPSRNSENMVVDHINRDTTDNRKENLRYVNRNESGINKDNMSDNSSGYTGVIFYKNRNKWVSYISVNGKRKHLGCFPTFEKAKESRKKAEKVYYPNIKI